ncbi:MAG: LamG-like jellyroll fold domain-containing protein, partial [Sediminibacterium sp.]
MKTMLHTISSSGFRNVRTVLLLTLLLFAGAAQAAHFRSGTISWRPISGNTVEFKVSQSYGGWAFGSGYTLGSTQIMDYLYTGNGYASVPIPLVVTSINAAEGWWYGEATFQYTYPSAGNYAAYFSSCCRISNLSNNGDQQWRNETIVNVGSGNSSPVSTIAATVNLPTSLAAANFQIPAFDPDGDVLSYRLATSAEMGGGTNPSGLAIDASTGVVSFNTIGKPEGTLWNVAFTISDGVGKTKVTVDFVIKITQNSTPPVFDYLVTPVSGRIYQGAPGQTISFPIRAYDNDAGNVVTLSAVGLPPGSTTSPSLPTNGNPVNSTFSWTPTASQFGSYVINFTATDNIGVQSTSSVTILISLKPVFNVPPTPAANSETYLETGVAHQNTITASDPDPNDVVQIMSVTGLPSGATLSTSLPTVAANPSSIQLNWTPTPSNFGVHAISFVAKDSYNDQTTHSFKYLVNTKPTFTSTPSTTVYVGQPFTYNITGLDPDVQYGDVLKLIGGTIPTWLTFTNNGNGTGTLSGTPSMANLGMHPVSLKLEDTYHHDYSPITTQSFTLNVSGVAPSIVVPANIVSCDPIVSFAATETVGIPASTITYSIAPGSSFPIGTTTVTATATNAVSSSTKTFTVTVSKPIADIAASGATTFCEGSNVPLSAAPYALQFNGSNHVNVANSFAATDDITIEATVTPTRLADGTFKVIMNHNSWYTGTIHFQFFPDGRLQFAINGATPADQYCTFNFIPNTTYRIAVVYSRFGNYVKFYVNGVLINTGLYFGSVPVVGNAAYSIGSWNGNERFFSGTIDDFRVWNVQRTDAQVLADAAALPIP